MDEQRLSLLSYSNLKLHEQGGCATSLSLRDEAKLFLIRPNRQSAASISMEKEGSYLCVSFTSEPVIELGNNSRALATNKLHLLRQPADARSRRIEFRSPAALAVVAFFSTRWCMACPRGPGCKVAQFLLRGNKGPAIVGDQALDLDDRGIAIARALLDSYLDEDVDVLSVEQSFLALLSWAFTKSENPIQVQITKPILHPQLALKVRQAAEILRQHFDAPPTIAQLSASVGLNESDLKRCFKCLYGDGIASYSRQRRLEAARDLLAYSTLGVAAIALEVGFANPSQFARAFRQQFGLNPSEYRRSPS